MVPAFVSFALGMVVLTFAANDWMILGATALLGFGVGTVAVVRVGHGRARDERCAPVVASAPSTCCST